MSLVVSDTSPLRALNQLDLMGVLPKLFGTVLVPPAVVAELSVNIPGVSVFDLRACPFIEVRMPSNAVLVAQFEERLGAGESEALVLALETKPDFVLIDDWDARQAAAELGLVAVGALGVLVRAKRNGLISGVAPLIDR